MGLLIKRSPVLLFVKKRELEPFRRQGPYSGTLWAIR